jgi:sterol 3beta-glucosyltransferase
MRILIATIGSRGDVQPYLALALGLQAAGHDIAVCTCPRYRLLIEGAGIAHLPLDEGLIDLLESPAGRLMIGQLDSIPGALRTALTVMREVGPIHHRIVADAWAACEAFQPQVIVYHPKLFCMPAFAARLKVTAMLAPLLPMQVATGQMPFWGMPKLPLGQVYNRASWRLVESLTRLGTAGYLRRWRRQHDPAGLSRESTPSRTRRGEPIPVIHGFSAAVWPRPGDWPAHAQICGYWFLPGDSQALRDWAPSPALQHFLDEGPAPVYIGFGSMAGSAPAATTRIVLGAVQRAGIRAVLARGWGGITARELPPTVHLLAEAPHEWLFPRMAAVVHHGGAGTTAAGLRAGRPTLICPFGIDQPFWGRRVHELGAGPAPLPQKRLSADGLARAIGELLHRPSYARAADSLADAITREDGIAVAITAIEQAHRSSSAGRP